MSSKAINMIDLEALHSSMKEELTGAFARVVSESKLILGPDVTVLEDNLGQWLEAKVVTCANGTDAIMLALMALDLPKGSEVIVPSFNYIAGPEVIYRLGLKPVFCDVEIDSFNISAATIEPYITQKTSAILVTHIFGQAVDIDPILELAEQHHLKVIEDNAQSLGAQDKQRFAGTLGHIGTTSFYPTKVLGCMGDGGAVITKDTVLADRVKRLRVHGATKRFEYAEQGMNSRLDTLQAAVLNIKLKYLESWIIKKRQLAHVYDDYFVAHGDIVPQKKTETHVFYAYSVLLPEYAQRDLVREELQALGIQTDVFYPNPVHQSSVFQGDEKLPNTEVVSSRVLALPIHCGLSKADVEFVSENLVDITLRLKNS